METAGKLAGFAVCAALVALILRRLRPEAGWGVSLGAGAIVLLAALPALSALVRGIASLSAMSGLDDSFMQQLLKSPDCRSCWTLRRRRAGTRRRKPLR